MFENCSNLSEFLYAVVNFCFFFFIPRDKPLHNWSVISKVSLCSALHRKESTKSSPPVECLITWLIAPITSTKSESEFWIIFKRKLKLTFFFLRIAPEGVDIILDCLCGGKLMKIFCINQQKYLSKILNFLDFANFQMTATVAMDCSSRWASTFSSDHQTLSPVKLKVSSALLAR